jgi:hypothetical protein
MKSLVADGFIGVRATGKTLPLDLRCHDSSGNSFDVVVKLKDSVEGKAAGLVAELLANKFAEKLGLLVPEAVIVDISAEFADLFRGKDFYPKINNSQGLNFGTCTMTGGYTTWLKEMGVSHKLFEVACQTVAFDSMIYNPDRRIDKPNMLWKGDEIFLIDHELAFAFQYEIFPNLSRWRKESFGDISKGHIFFHQLRGQVLNFGNLEQTLTMLSDDEIEDMGADVPSQWPRENVDAILSHIKKIARNSNEFFRDLRVVMS